MKDVLTLISNRGINMHYRKATYRHTILFILLFLSLTLGAVTIYTWYDASGEDTTYSKDAMHGSLASVGPTSITVLDVFHRLPLCGVGISDCGSYQDSKHQEPYPPSALPYEKKISGNKIEMETDEHHLNFELIWKGDNCATVEVTDYAKFRSYRVMTGYHICWSEKHQDWEVTSEELLWIGDQIERDRIGEITPFNPPVKFMKP